MRKRIQALLLIMMATLIMSACGGATSTDTDKSTEEPQIVETLEDAETAIEMSENEQENSVDLESEDTIDLEPEVVTEEPTNPYTYEDVSATMYAMQNANVRDLPSVDGEIIGSVNTNDEIIVLGRCNETGWYLISYKGEDAYISDTLVSKEKPQQKQDELQSSTLTEKEEDVSMQNESQEVNPGTDDSASTNGTEPSVESLPSNVPSSEITPSESASIEPTPSAASTPSTTASAGMVWKSATGSKYHSINNCGKMNPDKATQLTEGEAIASGLEKCEKCW